MKKYILGFTITLAFFAFKRVHSDLLPIPEGWATPVYDFSKNPLSKAKIEIGRALFHDPILSADNTISCVSCHSQFTAFAHTDHRLSHGIHDKIGTRNAPSLMNLAWQNVFMWDGAIHHLDVQSLAPISHPDEMGESIEHIVKKLQKLPHYQTAFEKAYGDSLVTGERVLKSLSQFMLTFVSANSKYDKVKRGETTFTPQEQNGYVLFQKNCNSCHQEPLFTTHKFENNGLPIDTILNDWGRMKVTQKASDAMKFKIPTLRNIEFSYPYMHDGRFRKINDVLNHYIKGIENSPTLSPKLKTPIILTSNDKVDLTAFLLTLTDKDFLFNRDYMYPRDFFK
ncbi:MAG: cytochrome-c peroxidase [Saprospiraceae bacterium]